MQHAGKYGAAADKRWHECPDSCEIYAYLQFSIPADLQQGILAKINISYQYVPAHHARGKELDSGSIETL